MLASFPCLTGRAQSWTPVPSADFASLSLTQFADHEIEVPYYLFHFAQVANAVVETGTDRGFLNIKVNREPVDNQPYNARIMENQLSLAYFYSVNRPWNPYRGHPAVRVRLEAMLDRWARIQNQPGSADGDFDGLYAEYSATNWSQAPTSFGVMHAAEAVDLIRDAGVPFDATVLENARVSLRRALMALFTRADMRSHARQWSNQFNGSYHAALIYLENWPDAELDAAFAKAVADSAAQDQSPAGFYYEQEGPDFGYSGVHDNNLRVALPRLRARADLLPIVSSEDTHWNEWLAANFVLQPGLSPRTFLTNAGLNTRTSHSFQTPRSRPLSEWALPSRIFSYTDAEYAASVTTRRAEVQNSFGRWGALSVNNAYSYIPAFVFDAVRPLNVWHPTSAQRAAADATLPCLAAGSANRQFHDPRPVTLTTAKRAGYYATVTTGNIRISRQNYGLGLLWGPKFGVALQSVANTLSSNAWAYGTRRSGVSGGATYETANLGAAITAGGAAVSPVSGARDLAAGDVVVTYPLAASGVTYGQKTLTLGASRVDVSLTHTGAFTEMLPFAHASDAVLSTSATRAVLQRPDGSSLLLQITSPGATLSVGGTSALTTGLVRRAATITASGSLSYSLTVSETPPPPETVTPALAVADVSVDQPASAAGSATLTVTLSAAASGEVSVNYATANGTALAGTHYTAASGAVVFAAGQTSRTVAVPILPGSLVQGQSRAFTINLSSPSGATISRSSATVTINGVAPPPPSLSIADTALDQPATTAADLVFTISLSSAASTPVTVAYATVDDTATAGVHYAEASGSLSFAAGQTSRTVSVSVLPGALLQGQSRAFSLRLSAPSGATVSDDTAVGTIRGVTPPPPPPPGSALVEYVPGNSWGAAYQGTFKITNTSSATITGYQLLFEFAGSSITFFNFLSLTSANGTYTLTPQNWQANIAPNTSFDNLGFQASPGDGSAPPLNPRLRITSATNVATLVVATASPLAGVLKGASFSQTFAAGGGIGPYAWSLAPGSAALPPGLSFSADGQLTGTPTTAGAYSFTLRVTDLRAVSADKTFTLAIAAPDPFAAWIAARAWPAPAASSSAAAADPDADGLANLLEYALGYDPLAPGPGLNARIANNGGPRLALDFVRVTDPALVYAVEGSSDLIAWTSIWSSTGTDNTAGPVTVSDNTAPGASPRFLRLRVTR